MEFKAIIYIIAGIVYFIYSIKKKADEKKSQQPVPDNSTPQPKPVTPPTTSPLDEVMREIKRKQAEAEAKKKALTPQPKPLTSFQQKKPEKEILIHQKQKGLFEEGNYERDLTEEEKIERGKLKIENEGIYKIKPIEEMEEEESTYQLDIRDAVIGSVILERKF